MRCCVKNSLWKLFVKQIWGIMAKQEDAKNTQINDLSSKVALVTGGNRGIGRAIAVALATAGADVVVNYRVREREAQETCDLIKQHGCRSLAVQADVSLATEVARMVESVFQTLGAVSILVNNAGITRPQSYSEITEKDWDEVMAANLKSTFLVTQAVLPQMRDRGWGRIINLSSVAAQLGGVVGLHYAASKAGIIGLTHSYASGLACEGITVNAIAPALISTEMLTNMPNIHSDFIPVGRFGDVEEIASVALMLARNGYITGQTINVNGGWYMS
jgi:3-oxoacyl-[acyl-carrier protein] reductase